MKCLIIGGGGREHALAWKIGLSTQVAQVYVAPGNAGTALESKLINTPIAADDVEGLLQFAQQQRIDLTIVGPEAPLVKGVVDMSSAAGLACFGPSKAAAQLEGSKAFCKDFLARHAIPTAAYGVFTELVDALDYIHQKGTPIVIKADGLASGKGVVVAQTEAEAESAVHDMLADNVFGAAGRRVIIEEYLSGEEASFIVMADGEHILPLASSQDHKARDNGDQGPNTGGMGAYSPAPVVTPAIHQQILHEIIEPTIRGLAMEGCPYTGFLYAGLMISPDGKLRVLEFNCRLGDPETQPIMLRLDSDLVDLCKSALAQRLDQVQIRWDQRAALGVILAAGGYPGPYAKGAVIDGLAAEIGDNVKVFHAGTALQDSHIVTSGGRVLCVTALGKTVCQAQQLAYAQVGKIRWDGMYYRKDIGYRAVARENASDPI